MENNGFTPGNGSDSANGTPSNGQSADGSFYNDLGSGASSSSANDGTQNFRNGQNAAGTQGYTGAQNSGAQNYGTAQSYGAGQNYGNTQNSGGASYNYSNGNLQPNYGSPYPPYTGYDTGRPEFKFNWGAFLLSTVFAVGNKAWLSLLTIVPILNIVWVFVSGFKGEEWAWNSGMFDDVKSFRVAMRTWNRAGIFTLICILVGVLLLVLILGGFIIGILSGAINTYD